MKDVKWELYSEPGTYRLKIPGGYLYRHGFTHVCMAFAPEKEEKDSPPDEWTGYCERE